MIFLGYQSVTRTCRVKGTTICVKDRLSELPSWDSLVYPKAPWSVIVRVMMSGALCGVLNFAATIRRGCASGFIVMKWLAATKRDGHSKRTTIEAVDCLGQFLTYSFRVHGFPLWNEHPCSFAIVYVRLSVSHDKVTFLNQ